MLSTKQIAAIITSEMNQHPSQATPDNVEAAAQKIHDLCKPDHTIHVAAAALENEVTSTLLDMTVATVLAKLIDQEGGGRTNFSFSPMDMAAVMKEWSYTVEHDGMVRTVRIKPLDEEAFEEADGAVLQHSALARAMSSADDETAPPVPPVDDLTTKPQAATHEFKRPLWVVRRDGELFEKPNRKSADASVRAYLRLNPEVPATVENRWCIHTECPTSGCHYDASKRDSVEATSD